MAKKATQTLPNIVSFDQFLKLRGEQKEPLTIYFNEQQWKNLTKGMKPVDGKIPKKGVRLFLFASPSIPGGFGTLSCNSSSLFFAGGGSVICFDEKPGIPDVPPPPKLGACGLSFSSGAFLTCVGECRTLNPLLPREKCKRVVRIVRWGTGWVSISITCECQP